MGTLSAPVNLATALPPHVDYLWGPLNNRATA